MPTSIIVTTNLAELEAGAGRALTAGGTLLPMRDVLRLTTPAHHYAPASGRYPYAIFDKDKTLACGPDNRMVELRNYTTRKNIHVVT